MTYQEGQKTRPPTDTKLNVYTRASRIVTVSERECVRPGARDINNTPCCLGYIDRHACFYEAERSGGETFNEFAERVGGSEFEQQVSDLAMPVEFSLDTMLQFVDWSRHEPYKVERGEGECAV